jgi:quinol monooxygenase YgiN
MKGRSDKRKEIVQTLNGISDQIRLKKGCLNAKNYQDIDNEDIFYLVEEWETQQDMDDFMKSHLFAALLGIQTILVEKPEINILVEDKFHNNDEIENVRVFF